MSVRGTKEALSSTIQQRRSDPRTSRVCTLYPNKALVNGGKRLFFLSLLIDFFEGSCDPISSGAEAVIYMPCKLNQSFSTDRSEGSVAPGSLLLGKRAILGKINLFQCKNILAEWLTQWIRDLKFLLQHFRGVMGVLLFSIHYVCV